METKNQAWIVTLETVSGMHHFLRVRANDATSAIRVAYAYMGADAWHIAAIARA